jgi:ribonuclease E
MASKMLVDATHPEETRVVVVRGNRVEEFDFESANRRQLRGNIYLAKVTRVEPSLQAAFVDYGGNRHGFLAFSEIHPDYYQIPVADRQALIEEEERAHRESEAEHERRAGRRHRDRPRRADRRGQDAVQSEPLAAAADTSGEDGDPNEALLAEAQAAEAAAETAAFSPERDIDVPAEPADEARSVAIETDARERAAASEWEGERADRPADADASQSSPEGSQPDVADDEMASRGEALADHADEPGSETEGRDGSNIENVPAPEGDEEDAVESVGGADALEEVPDRAPRYRRQYKIQEVIKRRQVMLVQVVKEERGTKGAALTTYLSLAGRYSVLMPNTARGGGISRKITSGEDRRRLKEIAQELQVPEGMGVILRTAGATRTKAEVVRDFEYLLRVWEQVRDLTLKSTAPTLVYEEGSLVKRSIRDLYNKDIDEIVVAGDAAYTEAKDFMRMLMPSHAKIIKPYRDTQPVFSRFGVESQLDAMFSPTVQLRSGGYIVLNQTEALVAIDVNSGRATREHHIEDTALKTNLEASEEIARQLRLRDLAGLIVIDFIDMDENRNNRAVERRLKDALKNDRARIQVGRISHFGLMEMSRQRIRSSVLESSTDRCPHCGGSGHVRSVSSVALQLLRLIEETLLRGATHNLTVRTSSEIALYILNHKRAHLRDLEVRFQIAITVNADEAMGGQQPFLVEKAEMVHSPEQARAIAALPTGTASATDEAEDVTADEEAADAEVEDFEVEAGPETVETGEEADGETGDGDQRRRRRRRRGRRGGRERADHEPALADQPSHAEGPSDTDGPSEFVSEVPPEVLREVGEPPRDEQDVPDEQDGDEARPQTRRAATDGDSDGDGQRRRRRGRRGGRRRRGAEDRDGFRVERGADTDDGEPAEARSDEAAPHAPAEPEVAAAVADLDHPPAQSPAAPQPVRETAQAPQSETPAQRRRSTVRESFRVEDDTPAAATRPPEHSPPIPAPAEPVAAEPASPPPAAEEGKPRRTGWWAKRLLGG